MSEMLEKVTELINLMEDTTLQGDTLPEKLSTMIRDEENHQTRAWAWKLVKTLVLYSKITPASADVIVCRPSQKIPGDIDILVGVRPNAPWAEHLSPAIGGFTDNDDESIEDTAIREAREETGLEVHITGILTVSGPKRMHSILSMKNGELTYQDTQVSAQGGFPTVSTVFVGQAVGGSLRDTPEQHSSGWMPLSELANRFGNVITFDHAKHLYLLQKTQRSAVLSSESTRNTDFESVIPYAQINDL